MVLPTGVSPGIGQASRQRFSASGERRCAYKLQLSAAMYAQMYAQSLGSQFRWGGLAVVVIAPALDVAAGGHTAGVVATRTHALE